MIGYLIRRLIGAVLVLALVSLVTFALLDLAPGDAAQVMAGETASAEQLAAARHELGLDQPLWVRYVSFAGRAIFHGDLGTSIAYHRPVTELVGERFAHTLVLAVAAMLLAALLGFGIGGLAAMHQGTALDLGLMSLTALGISLPTFWLALLFILVFSIKLGWFPVVGGGDLAHLALPAICLALPTAAVIARLTRASLLDARDADYVRAAYAKGLGYRQVWWKHILRNSLIPVTTMAGLQLAYLLGGTFLVENIFSWPGLGRLVVQAIFDRDFPLIIGAVLLVGVIYQLLNLAVDLIQAVLDPRVGRANL